MDKKGRTIVVATVGRYRIVRENVCVGNTVQNIRFMGVKFPSWHAEIRILHTLLRKRKLLRIAQCKGVHMVVLRYNSKGKLARTSKPCKSCLAVLHSVAERYRIHFSIEFLQNGVLYSLCVTGGRCDEGGLYQARNACAVQDEILR